MKYVEVNLYFWGIIEVIEVERGGKRIWLIIYNLIKNLCSVFIVMYMYYKKCIFKIINIIFLILKVLWYYILIV